MTNGVILKPIQTEKATNMARTNTYTFEVDRDANKNQIAHVLEQLYKVKVSQIRVMNRKGKTRRAGRKMQTRELPDKKVAYITLKEGTIDLFPKA